MRSMLTFSRQNTGVAVHIVGKFSEERIDGSITYERVISGNGLVVVRSGKSSSTRHDSPGVVARYGVRQSWKALLPYA